MARGPSDRMLLMKLIEKYDTLGRWPTGQEMRDDPEMEDLSCYITRFGNITAAQQAAFVWDGRLTDAKMQEIKPRRKELLSILAQLAFERCEGTDGNRAVGRRTLEQIGGVPLKAEYARYCGGVDEARRMLGLPVVIPDCDDLIEAIQIFYEEKERVPTLADCEAGYLDYSRSAFERLFGGWNKAIIAAGLTPNQEQPNRRETLRKRRLLKEQVA